MLSTVLNGFGICCELYGLYKISSRQPKDEREFWFNEIIRRLIPTFSGVTTWEEFYDNFKGTIGYIAVGLFIQLLGVIAQLFNY